MHGLRRQAKICLPLSLAIGFGEVTYNLFNTTFTSAKCRLLMGCIVSFKNSHVEILTLRTSECDLFGNRVVADEIRQLKIRSYQSRRAPNPTQIPTQTCTQGECHVKVKGKVRVMLLKAKDPTLNLRLPGSTPVRW